MSRSARNGGDQAEILTCLADPTRRTILEVLSASAGMNAGEVATELDITRQGVMKHLRVLADAELVTSRRAGREVLYEVSPEPLRDTATWLLARADDWERQLGALKRAAEATRAGMRHID
ncbi:ArsR/SmtB family transcription factor [Demetria terragena]|uniref:ArsR/SmtB family transcription factor n=1 Tax=Demetria terragena TaxID=63959 RepID=UPI00037FF174|nr:metalloregulator ArsR/SmtB family transcription factor [Demetria terragena]